MQNQIPNLERYILAELQDMNAADTYIVSADIWVDCEQTHQVVNVLKKSDNTLVTTLFVESLTGDISTTAPTGSITTSECGSSTVVEFQVLDCSGANVGTPVSVEQTIVLNKVLTSICNPEAIFQPIVDELHDHIEPLLEKLADTVETYQPKDCAGANVGSPVEATNVKIVNATEVFCAIVNAIDSAKDAIVDAVNQANSDITTAIENSITVLEDIKSELETANTTLTNIETNTTNINTKLDTVIGKIDVMITSLSSIDTKLTTTNDILADILVDIGNIGGDLADILTAVQSIDIKLDDVIASLSSIEAKLDTLHTDLVGIQDTLNDILAELDHELIITAPTINCATDGANKVSFYTREKIVWDSEAGTQVSRAVEYSLDGEDFTASKPAGTVSVGACVLSGDITDTLVEFQVEDCDGNPVGTPMDVLPTIVMNKQIVSICNVQELADAINAGAKDYTSVLESIDTKLDELNLIKAELIQSNTTLSEIETNTSETNTKLDTVVIKLDEQITLLTDLKSSFEAGNLKLDDILAKLSDILVSIDAIKVDLADIKVNIDTIKVEVQEINLKLDNVINSLTSIETKLDTITTELETINTTLQSEFDETQVILNDLKDSIESTLTTFQAKDCDDVNIGTPEVAQKSVILNKVITSLCNVQELADAINAGQVTATGKAHDVNSIAMTVGQTLSIPSGHFSTLVFHAAKGEFKIENTSNDHSTIFTTTGTLSKFIEISEDGVGTATGSTNAPMTMDTRSNANDLAITNTYTVTAVRNGVLKLETYK
jgi:DNA repair ATPase RecN